MNREYYRRNLGEYYDKKILPVIAFVIVISFLSISVWGVELYYCYDNDTIIKSVNITFNGTNIGVLELPRTCPYGCVENVTSEGAVCGYAPIELTAYGIIALLLFFGVIYGWAKLTHKRRVK